MKLQPIEDHIIVEPIEAKNETEHGIILDEKSKQKSYKGSVLAVGLGKILTDGSRSPMDVKVGDVVHYQQYSHDELKIMENGIEKMYMIVKHSSILCIEIQ